MKDDDVQKCASLCKRPLPGFLSRIPNCGLGSKHWGISNYCFATSHHHKQASKKQWTKVFSTLHREPKHILGPPLQLVRPKTLGSACNNSLNKTLQTPWKTVNIESSESSLPPRIVAAGRKQHLQLAPTTCIGGNAPFRFRLIRKVCTAKSSVETEVNAPVCTVMPCAALCGVMTVNTAIRGVWHNVTLVAFSQQTEPPLDLWAEAWGKNTWHLLAAVHFLIDTSRQ